MGIKSLFNIFSFLFYFPLLYKFSSEPKKKGALPFIDFTSLLEPIKIDTNYIFNNVIKHIKVDSRTKLIFTELEGTISLAILYRWA